MNCPKCGAANVDGAEYCSLCFEFFKPKQTAKEPPPTPKAPDTDPPLHFEEARFLMEGWSFTGPLLVTREGFYFFVRESAYEGKLGEQAAKAALGKAAGLAGGALLNRAEEGWKEGQRPPSLIELKPREEVSSVYEPVLPRAPRIVECARFFRIARERAPHLSLHSGGVLELAGTDKGVHWSADVSGLGSEEDVATQLARKDYVISARRGWKLSYVLLLVAGLAAAAAFIGDFLEIKHISEFFASLTGVEETNFGPDGTYYVINGREVAAGNVPFWVRFPIYKMTIAFGLLVWGAWFISYLRSR